jgi:hypothetical protein
MQVNSAMMLILANFCIVAMVVKDFGRNEMDLTGEQKAHDQGVNPRVVPKFAPASQGDDFAFS